MQVQQVRGKIQAYIKETELGFSLSSLSWPYGIFEDQMLLHQKSGWGVKSKDCTYCCV